MSNHKWLFSAPCCHEQKLPDAMLQTRDQQAGEQPPTDISGMSQRHVIAEDDAVAVAAYSGHV